MGVHIGKAWHGRFPTSINALGCGITRQQLSTGPKRPDAGPEERFATALEHARLALRIQGDTRKTALEFRKHFGWYTRGVPGAAGLRERLFQIESMAEAEAIFARYLERREVGVAA